MARINSFPQAVDFRAPDALSTGSTGSVVIQPSGSLLITLPPAGQSNGGYSQHDFARTKTLNVRQRITALTANVEVITDTVRVTLG